MADEILDVSLTPSFETPLPVADEPNPADSFLASTWIGRVLDAFGEGAKAGWGSGPLGLSPESEKSLREGGIFKSLEPSLMDSFKTFNEAMIRPAAAGLDLVMRGVSSVATGVAGVVGQTAEEMGEDPGMAKRLTRDTLMLAETFGIVSGTPAPRVPRAARGRVAEDAPAAPDGPAAAPFPKPELPVRATDDFVPEAPAVDKAGNINLDRIAAPKDVKDVIREVAQTGDDFVEARRGVMTLRDTEELADALGMTPEVLTQRKIGEAFNAEEAVAARNLLVQSAERVREMALKAANGADNDVIAFQEAMTRHVAIQEQVAGLTAEAGRALSSFRIMAKGTGEAQDLAEVIKQMGGRDNISDIARKITSFNSPQQISKFLADSRQAKTSDMLIEVWINALLSGPQTHAVNVVSNSLIALWRIPETAVAAGVGAVRRAAGIGAADRVVFSEVAARTWGYGQGAKEGIVAAWRMFKSDMGALGEGEIVTSQFGTAAKVEARNRRAIPSKTVTIGGKQFEIGGAQLRTPTNLLSAEDEFFKAVGYRQELNALAYRQASTEGLTGRAFANRVAGILNDPPANMVKQARDNADYQTFQKKLGPLAGAVQQFSNAHPGAKVVIPFVRTPVNIVKFAGERSPLGMFSDEFKGKKTGVEQDTAIARVVLGSSVGAATAALAAEGLITGGGPTDSRERAVLYASGWQPYSVRIGEMWRSYSRFDPFALIMGISADMYDIGSKMTELEADKLAGLVVASISKNLVNKTWLKGPAELIEAVADPDRYGDRYVQHLLGTIVPTGAAQMARVDDPYLKDAQSLVDTIKSRVPGLSTEVQNKRDIWGEPIKLEGGFGPDVLSPIYESRIMNDPVAQELIRLKIWPAPVERKIRGVELTPEQYDTYARYAGRFMRYNLDLLVGTPGWGEQPEFARRETIEKTVTKSRKAATSLMLMENPDLIEKAVQERVKNITGSAAAN